MQSLCAPTHTPLVRNPQIENARTWTNTLIPAYDDKDSTFVVPTGGSYQVVFCPSGRSTAIIANSSAQAVAKSHGGLTSAANVESISPPWILACAALVFTAGIFSML